jgi:hypothetical protein
MKKNKFLFVFIGLLTFSGILLAQTPGYMGKRLVIGYGFHFSPALFGSNAQGATIIGKMDGNASGGEMVFNALHEGYLEYALSKRFSLGISTKFYKTTYDNHEPLSVSVNQQDQYGYISPVYYDGNPKGLYYIKGQNYALYGKLFKRGFIAPWGKYMMFGINIKRYTCSYDPAEMKLTTSDHSGYYYDNYPPITDFGPREQSFTRFDVLFGFGRTRVLYNRITLDYGFNLNLFATVMTLFDVSDYGLPFSLTRPTNTTYIESTAPWRIRGVNRCNAFLRVGVLLF